MVESDGGIYEVTVDGTVVFTNDAPPYKRGDIPDDALVINLLHKRLPA